VAHRIPGQFFLRNLVEKRGLLYQLVRRDFEQRFVGSAIGRVLGGYPSLGAARERVLVFTVCMGVTLPKTKVTQNYPLFLFAGQLPRLLFSDTVQRSASSVLEQGSPITKTVFSRRNDSHFGISVNPGRPLARPGADGGGLWR
jgi:lipopolysaccharide transport system permease protein